MFPVPGKRASIYGGTCSVRARDFVARPGVVRMRLIPAGPLTGLQEVPTYELPPAVLAKRRNNRGFEGIAATADGILYAAVQRPLNNPNRAAADASQNIRLVAIN